jgi:vacuolar protein sorting-associated protein IST1
VLWACSRVDISELEGVKKQLIKKYGQQFYEDCDNNVCNRVNSRVVQKLNISPPEPLLLRKYLMEIANVYNVQW